MEYGAMWDVGHINKYLFNRNALLLLLIFSISTPIYGANESGCRQSWWAKLYSTSRDVVVSVATGQPLPRPARSQATPDKPRFYDLPTVPLGQTLMTMARYLRDPLQMFTSLQGADGVRIFRFPYSRDIVTISDYDTAKWVLLNTGKEPMQRDPVAVGPGARIYGDTNVFFGNPEQHKLARGYVQKAFAPSNVYSQPVVGTMHAATSGLVDTLRAHAGGANRDKPVDVVAESRAFALHAMLRTAFGLEVSRRELDSEIWPHFERTNIALVIDTVLSNTGLSLSNLPEVTSFQRRLNDSRAAQDKLVDRIIENGRRPDAPKDFLFYEVLRDPKIPPKYLRSIIKTVIAGAMETSASYVYWPVKELARHPEMVNDIRKEIKEVVGDGPIRAEHIPKLKKLENFVKEAGRQYTPFYLTVRSADEDMVLPTRNGPVQVRKGTQFLLSLYGANHDPNVYNVERSGSDPDIFDPLRWAEPDDGSGRDGRTPEPLTFGKGKHVCIGTHLAHLEAMMATAELIRNFDMKDASGGKDPRITSGLVTRPADGIHVYFTPRGP